MIFFIKSDIVNLCIVLNGYQNTIFLLKVKYTFLIKNKGYVECGGRI